MSSSSDLTVSVSEDDLILKSPELQTNLGDTMEQEDGTETLNVIHSEQERDAPSTGKPNCILQAPSTPDSPNESFTNLQRSKSFIFFHCSVLIIDMFRDHSTGSILLNTQL